MEELNVQNLWSIDDNDQSLASKGGSSNLKFGLNENVRIKSITFNPNVGKDGAPANGVDIVVDYGGTEIRRRMFEVSRLQPIKKGNNDIAPGTPGFEEAWQENTKQANAVVIHAVKALGVPQDKINAVMSSSPIQGYADWAQRLLSLLPVGYENIPVDSFLEYQWAIGSNQNRTFLEIPKNMKGGRFFAPYVAPVGAWTEQREWTDEKGVAIKGLRYVDTAGNVHTFTRDQRYMESNKAIQQINGSSTTQGSAIAGQTPSASTW